MVDVAVASPGRRKVNEFLTAWGSSPIETPEGCAPRSSRNASCVVSCDSSARTLRDRLIAFSV